VGHFIQVFVKKSDINIIDDKIYPNKQSLRFLILTAIIIKVFCMNFQIVSPIFGFDSLQEVTFLEIDAFFSKIVNAGVSFTLINPLKLRPYEIEIPLFYKNLLKVESGDDVRAYCTVIVDSDITQSTVNFAAPIILNHSKHRLVQVALDDAKYAVAEPISSYL
jgi:flagellar assembly factor FliW